MNKQSMTESAYQNLKEKSWAEPLSAEETAELKRYLAVNPQMQQDWDDDAALTAGLSRLPNAPVSSNFTSRVMQAVQHAEQIEGRARQSSSRGFWRRGWIPKFALAIGMLCLGTFSFHEYQLAARAKMTAEVTQFAETAPIPQLEWLKDFDTIERMSQVQVADNELLMAKR
jgi:anti-sigma factor RsiW